MPPAAPHPLGSEGLTTGQCFALGPVQVGRETPAAASAGAQACLWCLHAEAVKENRTWPERAMCGEPLNPTAQGWVMRPRGSPAGLSEAWAGGFLL